MRRSQKSKSVTWPSDVKLCQAKLFTLKESPSKVGRGTEDYLHMKGLRPVQSGGIWPDDNLPPGFEAIQPANLWRVKLSQIPLAKWRCPPRFEVNNKWQVVAGEESNELEAENQREMRVFEAIYPRPSAVPPNPSVSPAVADSFTNDQNTPIVPITPIEDDEAAMATSPSSVMTNANPTISQPQQVSDRNFPHVNGTSARAVEPDIIAAALAALTSVTLNINQGGLLDRNLLMKILSDPKMLELLMKHGASSSLQNGPSSSWQDEPSSSFQSMPVAGAQTITSSSTEYKPNLRSPPKNSFDPIRRRYPLSAHITKPEHIGPSMTAATGSLYPPQIRTGSGPTLRSSLPDVTSAPSSIGAPTTKGSNYYKNLIQQHGGERQDTLPQFAHRSNLPMGGSREPVNFMKSRDQKPKIMTPCIYFNGFKGCRNGNNCAYLHDNWFQERVGSIPEVQSAKRVKLGREICSASVSKLAYYT